MSVSPVTIRPTWVRSDVRTATEAPTGDTPFPSSRSRTPIHIGKANGGVSHTLGQKGGAENVALLESDMPAHTRVMTVEVSPHDPATAYVAGIRYEMDDRAPYAWKTNDYGASWTKIVNGIPAGDLVRVIREDPHRAGLLYAGTEHGVYVSFDDGGSWSSLSFNLPNTPVTGLVVEDRDVVISTHGRSFWVLDDIETLRQLDSGVARSEAHLFRPADAVRRSVPAVIDYHVPGAESHVRLEILDADGENVRTLVDGGQGGGSHRTRWNLRYAGAVTFEGIVLEGGNPAVGPWAAPGRYQVRLTVGGGEWIQHFDLHRDPRLADVTDADLKAQFALAVAIRDAESEANEGVVRIRDVRRQLGAILAGSDDAQLGELAARFLEDIGAIEAELYQVRNQSPKDKIAFPIKLNDRLTGLRSHLERGDGAPTEAYRTVFEELSAELDLHARELHRLIDEELPGLNRALAAAGLPQVVVRGPGGA